MLGQQWEVPESERGPAWFEVRRRPLSGSRGDWESWSQRSGRSMDVGAVGLGEAQLHPVRAA